MPGSNNETAASHNVTSAGRDGNNLETQCACRGPGIQWEPGVCPHAVGIVCLQNL